MSELLSDYVLEMTIRQWDLSMGRSPHEWSTIRDLNSSRKHVNMAEKAVECHENSLTVLSTSYIVKNKSMMEDVLVDPCID